MKSWIALLPALFSTFYLFIARADTVFLNLYLPILLLTPQIYHADISVFQYSFHQSCIVPISIAIAFGSYKWKISFTDILIIIYVGACGYSEFIEIPSQTYRNVAGTVANVLCPYLVGKILIRPLGIDVQVCKRIIYLLCVAIFISILEMIFAWNIFIMIFKGFFQGEESRYGLLLRYGFVRITGPFATPIFYGTLLAIAIIFNLWLLRNKQGKTILLFTLCVLSFGFVATFSRGPMTTLFIGLFIFSIGFAKNRKFSFTWRFVVLMLVAVYIWQYTQEYSNVNLYMIENEMTGTMAYRVQMNIRYLEIAMQKPVWGWGSNEWPIIPGMKSIDNHYLWLMLKHGLVALGIFCFTALYIGIRMTKRSVFAKIDSKAERTFNFALLGIYVGIIVGVFTVFLSDQLEIIYYLLCGWIEGVLASPQGLLKLPTASANEISKEAEEPSIQPLEQSFFISPAISKVIA